MKTKINVTNKLQIDDLEGIFFPRDVVKLPRVCKKSIMPKPQYTHRSMPCQELC